MPRGGYASITVTEDVYSRLEKYARAENQSVSGYVELLTDRYGTSHLKKIIREEVLSRCLQDIVRPHTPANLILKDCESILDQEEKRLGKLTDSDIRSSNVSKAKAVAMLAEIRFVTSRWYGAIGHVALTGYSLLKRISDVQGYQNFIESIEKGSKDFEKDIRSQPKTVLTPFHHLISFANEQRKAVDQLSQVFPGDSEIQSLVFLMKSQFEELKLTDFVAALKEYVAWKSDERLSVEFQIWASRLGNP